MLDYQIVCEFSDLERGIDETSVLGFAAENDLEAECELHAMSMIARYNIMPQQRGKYRWEIREPGELLVVIRAEKVWPVSMVETGDTRKEKS